MKSKRKIALAVIMALIVSMLPMTVFADSAQQLPAGTYDANPNITIQSKGPSPNIGMYFASSNVKIIVKEDGKIDVAMDIARNSTSPTTETELYAVYKGDKDAAPSADPSEIINVANNKLTIADVKLDEDLSYSYQYKKNDTPTWANTKFHFSVKSPDVNPEPEAELNAPSLLKVKILRIGNVKEENLNTEISNERFVTAIKGNDITLKLKGKYSKMFPGVYTEAEYAQTIGDASVKELELSDGYATMTVTVPELNKPVNVSLYSESMSRWIGYSFIFSVDEDYEEVQPDTDEFKKTENGIEIKAEDKPGVLLTAGAIGNIRQAGAPVQIKNNIGTVAFDADAVMSIFGPAGVDNVKFDMKDIKASNPIYADSDYDMVLELNITDLAGNNLFAEGANGKAKITVPYDKEVQSGKTVKVFYISTNGKEEVEAKYDADAKTVTFEVSHFSQYGIEQVDTTKNANTGDNSLVILFIGLMMLSGVAFVATKKGLIK